MSDETPRLKLAQLVSLQELNSITWNEALAQLDALVDLCLLGQYVNTPPASASDGDAYLLGGAPSGAWNGYAYKIAVCLDGAWRFYTPFNGLRAYVATTAAFIVYLNGVWTDWNSLISANEVAIASAATCALGAVNALFVQITGTTTIGSFGSGTSKLRFVRFAQSLTLTHNAAALILLGGASRVTAAGDVGIYASDASGNWRERGYFRASGAALAPASTFASFSGVGQLPFPAAQLASTDPNILDDYEEGTFTPTLSGTTTAGTPAYTTQQACYTKLGRLVVAAGVVAISAKGGLAGNVLVGGLPFTSLNSTIFCGFIGNCNGITLDSGYSWAALQLNGNAQAAFITENGSGQYAQVLSDARVAAAAQISFTLAYMTS